MVSRAAIISLLFVALLLTALASGHALPERVAMPGYDGTFVRAEPSRQLRLSPSDISLRDAQGGLTTTQVQLERSLYHIFVSNPRTGRSELRGRPVLCYELYTVNITPRRSWVFLVGDDMLSPGLVGSQDGYVHFTWVSTWRLQLWDMSQERPLDAAVADYAGVFHGKMPAIPRISVTEDLHRYYWLLPRQEYPPRIKVVSVRETPSGETVVRLRGALPWLTFTFIGNGQQWRVTWLSKHQLPLAGFFVGLVTIGMVAWVRRRRRAN